MNKVLDLKLIQKIANIYESKIYIYKYFILL